jgi:hypothetical protein
MFLDEEESDHLTDFQTVKRVPSSGATISHQTVLMVSKLEESFLSLGGEAKGTFAHEGVDPRP